MKKNAKVDEYIDRQKVPQKEICKRLRKLLLEALPDGEEEFKLGVPWYEDRFYIVGLRDSVNMGFCIEGIEEKEMGELRGKGKMMRHLKFRRLEEVDEVQVERLIRLGMKKATPSCGVKQK